MYRFRKFLFPVLNASFMVAYVICGIDKYYRVDYPAFLSLSILLGLFLGSLAPLGQIKVDTVMSLLALISSRILVIIALLFVFNRLGVSKEFGDLLISNLTAGLFARPIALLGAKMVNRA